jgi:hypothetical protein
MHPILLRDAGASVLASGNYIVVTLAGTWLVQSFAVPSLLPRAPGHVLTAAGAAVVVAAAAVVAVERGAGGAALPMCAGGVYALAAALVGAVNYAQWAEVARGGGGGGGDDEGSSDGGVMVGTMLRALPGALAPSAGAAVYGAVGAAGVGGTVAAGALAAAALCALSGGGGARAVVPTR